MWTQHLGNALTEFLQMINKLINWFELGGQRSKVMVIHCSSLNMIYQEHPLKLPNNSRMTWLDLEGQGHWDQTLSALWTFNSLDLGGQWSEVTVTSHESGIYWLICSISHNISPLNHWIYLLWDKWKYAPIICFSFLMTCFSSSSWTQLKNKMIFCTSKW